MTPESYYVPLSPLDARGPLRLRATEATVGPWDPGAQHGSPPAALLARCLARALPREDARLAQLSFAFHGPVPVGELEVTTEVVRPGAKIERSAARLGLGARTFLTASAWRVSTAPGRGPSVRSEESLPPVPGASPQLLFEDVPPFGYGESLEWRFVEGGFQSLGPAAVWSRPRVALLPGEPLSPLERLLLMVDSANGISAVVRPGRYAFVPVELTVSVLRHPATEWVGMRASTHLEADGVGLTRASLFDEEGFLGTALQTLFVAPR